MNYLSVRVSVVVKQVRGPQTVCLEQGICSDDEFAHDDGDSDLGGFFLQR